MASPSPPTRRWGFAIVEGRSMLPTLRPGDRLLLSYRRPVRAGSIAVARFADGTIGIKRAIERTDRGWWLLSDNQVDGIDSRHRGAVADDQVVGVILARVWPWPRRLVSRSGF